MQAVNWIAVCFSFACTGAAVLLTMIAAEETQRHRVAAAIRHMRWCGCLAILSTVVLTSIVLRESSRNARPPVAGQAAEHATSGPRSDAVGLMARR